MTRVIDRDFALEPAAGLLGFIRAASQATRLVTENPAMTAYMVRRATGRPSSAPAGITTWVSLTQMSPYLICALVGAEDPLFFQHRGIWWHRIKVAIIRAVLAHDSIRGVSTITQQLARNLFLTPERTLARKVGEAGLTRVLESKLTKARILELYLNVVEWGEEIWGIASAARYYCDCTPAELDAFQSIVLVSLLPAPRRPLDGRNGERAFATQRRLPMFLYSAGAVSLSQERQTIARIARIERAIRDGMPLPQAIVFARATDSESAAAASSLPIASLLASQCGWTRRLRFEELLTRARENPKLLRARPDWWTDDIDSACPLPSVAWTKPEP